MRRKTQLARAALLVLSLTVAATATGVIRMLNNKHWMSDVLVGAGIGIFFTELTYYIYPPIKNFFSTRVFHRDLQAFSFSPYYYADNMGIHINFRF